MTNLELDTQSDEEGGEGEEDLMNMAIFKKGSKQKEGNKDPGASSMSFRYGPRMLQLALFDGISQECVAIEYEQIPFLNLKMMGAKIMVSGPVNVHLGTILLRRCNVSLVSSVTFDCDEAQAVLNEPNMIVSSRSTATSLPQNRVTRDSPEILFDDDLDNMDMGDLL